MGLYIREKEILESQLEKHEIKFIVNVVENNASLINNEKLLEKLSRIYSYGVFGGEMPYSVQTAHSDTPDNWLEERLSKVYGK